MKDEIPFFVPYAQKIPENAIVFGQYNGRNYYIGRSRHQGSLTPGIVIDEGNVVVCLIPWGCVSNRKLEFEILVGGNVHSWTVASNGDVPLNAFKAGHTEQGETLFIGRFAHQGHVVAGKIQPSHHVCYIPFQDQELSSSKYEVLVI